MKRGLVHISLTACLIFLLSSSMSIAVEIPQTGWSLWYVDSQELIYLGGMPAENAFDGNINTVWFTEYRSATPLHPHEIQIDLGESYDISGLRYSPFQGHSGYGRIEEYEFYVTGVTPWLRAFLKMTKRKRRSFFPRKPVDMCVCGHYRKFTMTLGPLWRRSISSPRLHPPPLRSSSPKTFTFNLQMISM